ncbi:hypothetical protein QTP88_015179 [Uroleucon formosanum]
MQPSGAVSYAEGRRHGTNGFVCVLDLSLWSSCLRFFFPSFCGCRRCEEMLIEECICLCFAFEKGWLCRLLFQADASTSGWKFRRNVFGGGCVLPRSRMWALEHRKTAYHCHLSGKYRQALCHMCNQKLQTPVFVPCFLHNLSNYDAHFIVTELGYDTQRITVIPNSEEKFISFSKYVSNNFTIKFIDTCRFMTSSLSSLAKNLITPGLENFRETAKVFAEDDMPLVTRKEVYPYEYMDSWERLKETRLPRKRDFYSTLTESGVKEEEFDHAKEIHRVIQFNQSDWLVKYIDLNTEMRKKAKNAFEKYFFKLINYAVFGKTMQSKRKEMKMELVSCERRLQKLINKSTFKHCINYNENLNAVALKNKMIKFDKPIYIGFAVLDISKTLMYDYHYNVMQRHYGHKIKLMYTDTDSLVYYIQTDDFYVDLAANPSLLDRMDTANLPSDHPCYIADRKKSSGPTLLMYMPGGPKDRDGCENIKAKGIRAHVVKNHMTLEDHRKCLFGEIGLELYKENVSIGSFNHQLMTIKINKLRYNSYDDKRVVLQDKVLTLAHRHYSLKGDELEDDWPELDEEGHNWKEEEKGLMRDLHCIT